MNLDEAGHCVKWLAAAYGGEWDETRVVVWVDTLLPLEVERAQEAVKALTRTEDYPTIARFLALYGQGNAGQVVCDGDRRFSPGIGWLGGAPEPAELEEGSDPVVVSMAKAREAIRRKKESA